MIFTGISEHKLLEAKQYVAGGVASSLRASMKPTPIYLQSASGARVVDVDNNRYIDYLLAYGPLILGHAHQDLTENLQDTLRNGSAYGLQHDGEIQLAKRLTEIMPCAEQVAFSGSGTEAVMLALRLARAYTGRKKIVRFYGHYHGWSDAIFTSFPSLNLSSAQGEGQPSSILPGTGGQSAVALEELIVLPWNDPEALEQTLREHHEEIAAVITEPVMCNSGCIVPKAGYLERMRELTEQLGIVLIWDEVITGFRLGLGGAHGRFGIRPDLVTVGKALAGGIPLSAVAGKQSVMRLIEDGTVSHLGTLNGNSLSMSAGLAVIDVLSRNGGLALREMETAAAKLADGLRRLLRTNGIPGVVNQLGPVFHMMFIDRDSVDDFDSFNQRDVQAYARFAEQMLEEGVIIRPNGLWYLSAAHGEQELSETLDAAERVLSRWSAGEQ